MSGRPFPLYTDEIRIETSHLTTKEFGAYMLLMFAYWRRGGLPNDDKQLANIIGSYDRSDWRAVKPAVSAMFGPEWIHEKLDIELSKKKSGGQWGKARQALNRCQTPEWRALRLIIFKRDRFTCQYCWKVGGKLECDHIFPASRGGGDEPENLKTSCKGCNISKRDMTPEEWLQ